jgi:hypothetical protein
VRTEITFRRSLGVGVDIESIVRASLHAGLAADASFAVEIDDAIIPPIKRDRRADVNTRSIVAVIASQYGKMTFCVGKLTFFDVFDPRPINSNRDIMLFLAGYCTGMTADAAILVDDKAVAH